MNHPNKQKQTCNTAPMIDIKTSQNFTSNETTNSDSTSKKRINTPQNQFAGKHYIVDFWGDKFLQDIDVIESALTEAADVAGAILLHIHLHKFSDGGGVTGVALLAESHISVHTWPENGYAAFDIFMCGNSNPEKAVALLQTIFQPDNLEVKELLRGQLL